MTYIISTMPSHINKMSHYAPPDFSQGSSLRTTFLPKRPKHSLHEYSAHTEESKMTYLQIERQKANARQQQRQFNTRLKSNNVPRTLINQNSAHQELDIEELELGQVILRSKYDRPRNPIELLEFSEGRGCSNEGTPKFSPPQHQPDPNFGKQNHTSVSLNDIWDLTYTLLTVNLPVAVILILFFVLSLIRFYTIAYLVNLAVKSNSQHIDWVMVLVGDRALYLLLVVKVSLNSAQTKTEITLKTHWNSKESQINQLFSIVNRQKLLKSILRGLVPAELSFLYLHGSPRRKFQVYIAINYIYASIESVLYYPFFIAYIKLVGVNYDFALDSDYNHATFSLVILALSITFGLSLFLFLASVQRKCLASKSASK